MTITENTPPTTPLDVATERASRRLPITDADTGLLTTTALVADVGSGRYRATPAEGIYL